MHPNARIEKRHDADNRSPELQAVIIAFLVLSWVTVLARCWVRIKMIKAFALDDWLTVITLQLFTIYSAWVLVGAHWGCGHHMHDLSAKQRVNAMRAWYFGEMFYIVTTTLLRFAVGAFLLRVATNRLHRNIVYGCFAINIIFNAYFLAFTVFQCSPINGFWLRMGGKQGVTCHADISVDSTYASSAISAFIDMIFGLLPAAIIWDLRMNRKKKIALGAIMGLGCIASVAPLVRIPYTITLAHSEDFLWSTVDVSIWSSVEPGMGLVAISLPALRPLFASIFSGFSTTSGTAEKSRTKHYGNNSRPSGSAQQGFWADDDDGLQLRGLPPRMGHMVSIEGGSGLKQGPAKLQKSPGMSAGSSPKTLGSGRNSEEAYDHTITRTYDFKTWSGNESSFYILEK